MFYSIYDNYGIIRLFACYATAYANSNEIYSYRAIFHIVGKIILQYAGFIISDNFPVIPLILAYSQMGTVADTLKILKLYKNSWNLTLIDQKWIVMPNDCHVYFLIGTEKKNNKKDAQYATINVLSARQFISHLEVDLFNNRVQSKCVEVLNATIYQNLCFNCMLDLLLFFSFHFLYARKRK